MNKTLYYDSNTHQLVIGDCSSNELKAITIEPTLSADTFKLSEDGKLQIKINGKYVFIGDKSLVGPTPLLKIEDGYWLASYDNGSTWVKLDEVIESLVLESKQDKQDDGLVLKSKKVVNAINETFYNIWNPVHYAKTGSSSESKIVLTENGELKLTWRYGDKDSTSPEHSIQVQTDYKPYSTVLFADRRYVDGFPSQREISTLNTSTKTIVGAINELALLHNLTGTISHKCSDHGRINFVKIEKTLSTGVEYILLGSVNSTSGYTDLACVIAIPKGAEYEDPNLWGNLSLNMQHNIKVIEFGSTFTLEEESVLYLVFMSRLDISDRLGTFDLPDAWIYDRAYIDHTISVTNLNIIPSSESQARQLENQKEIISQLGLQVLQLQTQLLELKNKTAWLDQLDQEEMLKYWGSKTTTEE